MRQSTLFSKTSKTAPKDEETRNAQLLERSGFVHKEMAGVYSFLPLGLRVLKNAERIIREEMEAIGGEEVLLPALQPKRNWEMTGRWQDFDVLFRFTSFYTKTEYVLGPTHEEVITPLAKRFISSYRDLPRYVFQIQDKFRDEKRAKSGLLRGREFLMKDLYSFHADQENAERYYEVVKGAYWKIMERAGLREHTYLTFASGGTFSQYSHEFQVATSAGEDTIFACDSCRVAVNDEVIAEQGTCPECGSDTLKKLKAVEVGNIFKLKTKYSETFDLTYVDEKGKSQPVLMGCYGMGLSRLVGTVADVLSDEAGLSWPRELAPYQVHLVALSGAEAKAEALYKSLLKAGAEVLYDDRDAGAGEKFADADLIGLPFRAVVSEKTGDQVELKKRGEKKGDLVDLKKLISEVS